MSTINEEKEESSISNKNTMKLLEIEKLFNSLSKAVCNNNCDKIFKELVIPVTQISNLFDNVKNRLKFLELAVLENDANDEQYYAISVFKNLFMKKKRFNLDFFEEKKNILKCFWLY